MTTQPSAHYQQHHDVDAPRVDTKAFRQGWRVRTRLDQLLADGRITPGEWQAAVEYRTAWAITLRVNGLSDIGAVRTGGGDPHRRAIAALAAVEHVRMIETIIGTLAAALCFACIVEDRTWAAIGRKYGRNHETVRDWTVEAIRGLARAWPNKGIVRGKVTPT